MKKVNLKKLKRDCIIAILVPGLFIAIMYNTLFHFSGLGLISIGMFSTVLLVLGMVKLFNQLDHMVWQHQLNAVVQKIHSPVLIADSDHKITYVSENFYGLPFAELLTQINDLPELLALQELASQPNGYREQLQRTTDMLATLSTQIRSEIHWGDEDYEWVVSPLFTSNGCRWATMVECIKKEEIQEPIESISIHTQSLPMIVIDKETYIQTLNPLALKFFGLTELEGMKLEDILFADVIAKIFPDSVSAFEKAFERDEPSRFIVSKGDKFYEMYVEPAMSEEGVATILLEVLYPCKEEMHALEEGWDRLHIKRQKVEQELVQFGQTLNQLSLYGQDEQPSNYQHPILKKSVEVVRSIALKVKCLNNEVLKLKSNVNVDKKATCTHLKAPMENVALLSDTIHHKVKEFEHDHDALENELCKLKSISEEQKGLQTVKNTPLISMKDSIDKALNQSVMLYEDATLTMHQLHENEKLISTMSDMMTKLEEGSHVASREVHAMHDNIANVLNLVTNNGNSCKERLFKLLDKVECSKTTWVEVLSSLKSLSQVHSHHEQSINRWQKVCANAQMHNSKVKESMLLYVDLATKLTDKVAVMAEFVDEPLSSAKQFEQVAIDSKKEVQEVNITSQKEN